MRFGFLICIFCFPLQVLANALPVEKVAEVPLVGSLSLQHYRLPNGLQIAIVEDDTRPIVTCQIAYRVGSAHEPPGRQGLAHLVEHLVCDHAVLGDPHANATTSLDATEYYATFPKEELNGVIAYMARGMQVFDVTQEAFDIEKDIVLAERARRARQARWHLFNNVYADMFSGHPYQFDGLGDADTIRSFTLAQAQAFHKRYYGPNNACLVVVGDVVVDDVLSLAVQHFGSIPQDVSQDDQEPDDVEPLHLERDSIQTTTGLQGSAFGVWLLPVDSHPDYYPLYLFCKILFAGAFSPARQVLIESGRALQMSHIFASYRYKAMMYYEAVMPSYGNYLDVAPVMRRMIQETVDSLSADDLVVGHNAARKILYGMMTDQSNLADQVAAGFIRTNNPAHRLVWMQNLDSIAIDDVRRVAQKYLLDQPITVFYLVPYVDPPSPEWQWYHNVLLLVIVGATWYWMQCCRTAVAGLLIVGSFVAPSGAQILNNQIYYVQDLRVPQTSLSVMFHTGGYQQETKETLGLHFALLRLYKLALADDVKSELDLLGAELRMSISDRDVRLRLRVFSENLDRAAQLLADGLESLTFSEKLLNEERPRIIDAFEDYVDDHKSREIMRYHLYENEEDKRKSSWEVLRHLKVNDVQQFWDKTLHAKVRYFSVRSDLSRSEVENSLKILMQSEAQEGFSSHSPPKRKEIRGMRAIVYPYYNEDINYCFWATNGLPRQDDDWFAGELIANAMRHVLIGKFREENGWSYSTGVVIEEWTFPPLLVLWADVRNAYLSHLVAEMFRMVQGSLSEPIFWRELTESRKRLKRKYRLDYGLYERMNQQIRRDRDGVAALSPVEYDAALDRVTEQDIRRVYDRLFRHGGDYKNSDFVLLFYGQVDSVKKAIKKVDINANVDVFDIQTVIQ